MKIFRYGNPSASTFLIQPFAALAPYMDGISEEEADGMIRTIDKFYQVMLERRNSFDGR